MAIQKGDIIYVDYIGYVADTNEVFDTTIEEEARKAGIYRSEQRYGPMVIAVGERWVVEGLDESFVGKDEGQEYEVEVPPEKGFGERDPKKIRILTEKRLRDMGVRGNIAPGNAVIVDGVPAMIRAVSGGRVLLDFNPPLAGKRLKYKVFIRKVCSTLRDKVEALVKRHSEELFSKATIRISEKTGVVELRLNGATIKNPSLHPAKKGIADDILKLLKQIKKVRFVEEVSREAEEQPQQTEESSQGGRGQAKKS